MRKIIIILKFYILKMVASTYEALTMIIQIAEGLVLHSIVSFGSVYMFMYVASYTYRYVHTKMGFSLTKQKCYKLNAVIGSPCLAA